MTVAVVSAPASPEVQASLLTIPEAAQALRMGVTSFYGLMWSGALTPVRFGRLVRIRRSDLDRLIEAGGADIADSP